MVIKGGIIELKCKACGGVSSVDMAHKLCTYILKNPPPEYVYLFTLHTTLTLRFNTHKTLDPHAFNTPASRELSIYIHTPHPSHIYSRMKKIKRPSKVAEETAGQAEDKEKKERRERRKKEKEEREKAEKQDSDDDVVWYTDTSKEAAAERQKQMLDNTSELAAKLLATGLNGMHRAHSQAAFLTSNKTRTRNKDLILL